MLAQRHRKSFLKASHQAVARCSVSRTHSHKHLKAITINTTHTLLRLSFAKMSKRLSLPTTAAAALLFTISREASPESASASAVRLTLKSPALSTAHEVHVAHDLSLSLSNSAWLPSSARKDDSATAFGMSRLASMRSSSRASTGTDLLLFIVRCFGLALRLRVGDQTGPHGSRTALEILSRTLEVAKDARAVGNGHRCSRKGAEKGSQLAAVSSAAARCSRWAAVDTTNKSYIIEWQPASL